MGEILLLLWKCSRELLNNLLLCSEEKHSCIGTQVKVWTKRNSLKLNPTLTILCLNINNTKMLVLMMMKAMGPRKRMVLTKVMIKCFFLYKRIMKFKSHFVREKEIRKFIY